MERFKSCYSDRQNPFEHGCSSIPSSEEVRRFVGEVSRDDLAFPRRGTLPITPRPAGRRRSRISEARLLSRLHQGSSSNPIHWVGRSYRTGASSVPSSVDHGPWRRRTRQFRNETKTVTRPEVKKTQAWRPTGTWKVRWLRRHPR